MPTLSQLEYLVAVDRLRHFVKAAKACHVTQPTLSMQIQKAEEELGVVIFDRDKQPVIPTEKGLVILEQARTILREYEKLQQLSKQESQKISGRLSLGIIPTLGPYLLPKFLKGFLKKYPELELKVEDLKTEEIIKRLREDTLDAGILATPLHEKGLRERVLFYEPFFLYVNKDHGLFARKKITEEDLDAEGLWLLNDGHCFRNQIINYCAKDRNQHAAFANLALDGGSFETLRGLIRTSGGFTLFPFLFIDNLSAPERTNLVKSIAPPIPMREISLLERRGHWKSYMIDALEAEILRSLPDELTREATKKRIVVPV